MTEYVFDIKTGETLGKLTDINPLSGMIRYLARGGGYRSIMTEYVRIEWR